MANHIHIAWAYKRFLTMLKFVIFFPQKTYLSEDYRLHRSLNHIVTVEICTLVQQFTRITVRSLADLHLSFCGRQASLLYPDKLALCFAG